MTTKENVEVAWGFADKSLKSLILTMREANSLEALVLQTLIKRAAELRNDIGSMLHSIVVER